MPTAHLIQVSSNHATVACFCHSDHIMLMESTWVCSRHDSLQRRHRQCRQIMSLHCSRSISSYAGDVCLPSNCDRTVLHQILFEACGSSAVLKVPHQWCCAVSNDMLASIELVVSPSSRHESSLNQPLQLVLLFLPIHLRMVGTLVSLCVSRYLISGNTEIHCW